MVRIKDAKKNVIAFFPDVAFTKLFKNKKIKIQKNIIQKIVKDRGLGSETPHTTSSGSSPRSFPFTLSLKSPLLAQLLR
nr:hypothetical protein CFP56_42989 [Quercus suber]